jgi:hypothetical protein
LVIVIKAVVLAGGRVFENPEKKPLVAGQLERRWIVRQEGDQRASVAFCVLGGEGLG